MTNFGKNRGSGRPFMHVFSEYANVCLLRKRTFNFGRATRILDYAPRFVSSRDPDLALLSVTWL